jgi:hypothetical protein
MLDVLTVLLIVARCALLWLNFRRRPHGVILTKMDDDDLSMP